MLTDVLQHVHQVGVRIKVVQLAGADQALDDPQVFGSQFGPAEHPIFATQRNGTQSPFQMVGVRLHLRVFQEDLEAGFACDHIVQCFGQRVTGEQTTLLKLLVAPLEEALNNRLLVFQPVLALFLSGQLPCTDVLFVFVQSGDLLQGLGGPFRVIALGGDKVATAMYLMRSSG